MNATSATFRREALQSATVAEMQKSDAMVTQVITVLAAIRQIVNAPGGERV